MSQQPLALTVKSTGLSASEAQARRQQRTAYFEQWLTAPMTRLASGELIAERRLEATAPKRAHE